MYSVRPFEQKDLAAAAQIEAACFTCPWSKQSFDAFLDAEDRTFLAAEDARSLVGYAILYWVREEGCIANLAVREDARGNGVGRALVAALMDAAYRERLESVTLEVRESNAIARALYESFGFSVRGRRKNYYKRPAEDAVIYTRELDVESL